MTSSQSKLPKEESVCESPATLVLKATATASLCAKGRTDAAAWFVPAIDDSAALFKRRVVSSGWRPTSEGAGGGECVSQTCLAGWRGAS